MEKAKLRQVDPKTSLIFPLLQMAITEVVGFDKFIKIAEKYEELEEEYDNKRADYHNRID